MKKFYILSVCLLVVSFNLFSVESDSTKNVSASETYAPFYLGIGTGINNVCGMAGILAELQVYKNVSLAGGVGLGGWGYKSSIGIRIYHSYPRKLFYGIGFSSASGMKNFEYDIETTRSSKEKVTFDLNRANNLNLSLGYQWRLGRNSRLNMELGYSIALQSNAYDIKTTGVILTDNSKAVMDFIVPGGLMFGLGLTFGL
jgi:hypothetical protein